MDLNQASHQDAFVSEIVPNRRILVIDDTRAIHSDFRKILCKKAQSADALADVEIALFGETVHPDDDAAFDVDSAYQGEEALEMVMAALQNGVPYAMAFLDVRMPPGWDGIMTAARLWAADPDLQIVLCTAYSDYSWDGVRERLGRSDRLLILKKPFDAIEAFQLADALTEKWRLTQQARVRVANLSATVEARTHDLKAVNAELTASNERYRLLMEKTSAWPWELDVTTWRTLYLAPQLSSTLGVPCESPEAFVNLLHPEDREPFKRFVTEAARGAAQEGHMDSRLSMPDGGPKYLRSFVSAQNRGDEAGRVCGMSLDVTRQKQLERDLAQAHKLESIGQLAAGIAHEINTPTQFISANIRFLQDSVEGLMRLVERLVALGTTDTISAGEIAELLKDVDAEFLLDQLPKSVAQSLEGLERISNIVSALKEFSKPSITRSPYDINCAIENTITVASNKWQDLAQVRTDLDTDLPPVPIVLGAFNQVILDILVNAAYAIGAAIAGCPQSRGLITVSTRKLADCAEIRIQDTGCGIPEKILGRIFDPFFTTKPVGQGTGQGLAIAHDVIVSKHQGSITAESTPGVGTTLILRLPLEVPA
jgi:two-component system, NtrC family, sensor kinase